MPLVAAKCTQCGANLQIDNSHEATICPYCHTPFITEKAIINYKTYNEYKIEKADLHIHDEKSIETRLKNAEIFFTKHKNIDKAYELFLSVTNDAPDDYRGWWGLVRTKTDEFRFPQISRTEIASLKYYANCTFNVAPSDILDELKQAWLVYSKSVYEFQNQMSINKDELIYKLKSTEKDIDTLQNKISNLSYEIEQSSFKCLRTAEQIKSFPPLIIIGIFIISMVFLIVDTLFFYVLSVFGLIGFTVLGVRYLILRLILNNEEKLYQEKEDQKTNLINTLTNTYNKEAILKQQINYVENILS